MEEKNLFKSHVVHDLATCKEFQRGYDRNVSVTTITRLLLILFTVYFCIDIRNPIRAIGFLVVVAAWGLVFLIVWLCTRNGNVYYKRQLANNFGQPLDVDNCFTESAILSYRDGTQLPGGILYDQVRYVIETNNLLALILKHRQGVMVNKSNLEGGTQEEFLNFLRRSCVNWKNGRVRKGTANRILTWIWAICIAVTAVLAVCNLPGVQLFDRMDGAVLNTMSYGQIAEKLEPLGITGSDEAMHEDLEYHFGEYYTGPDYCYYHKSTDLLVWVGMGEYDSDANTWTPCSNGVFAPDYEPYILETMYTDFLRGIDAMNPGELEITDITEDISRLDPEAWTGTLRLSFTLNGQPHEMEFHSPGPWLDDDAMVDIARRINALDASKQLYFASDEGTGLLIFYRDSAWAEDFMRITKVPLFPDPNLIYG